MNWSRWQKNWDNLIAKVLKFNYYGRLFFEQFRFKWRDGRAVEGARLESVYTATYQGFESLSLRHYLN